MGYRTNGRWIIKGPSDKVHAAWAAIRMNPPPVQTNDSPAQLLSCFEVYTIGDSGYIRFSFDDWKWYRSYPDVQFFECVWADLMDSEEELSGCRIHVGEDNEIETYRFGNDEVMLWSQVSIDDDEPGPPTTKE